jgi:TonB family protein
MPTEISSGRRFAVLAAALAALATSGSIVGNCQSQKEAGPCDGVTSVTSWPKMVFGRVGSPGSKARGPVVRVTIREDGSVAKVKLLRSSRVKSWDEEVVSKMRTARYSEARGCGERTSEMRIVIDYGD